MVLENIWENIDMNVSFISNYTTMKVISKIYQKDGSRVGECVDGSLVPLVTWLKNDSEIRTAVECGWSAWVIFKVEIDNKRYPLGHPKGGYIDSQLTTVLF